MSAEHVERNAAIFDRIGAACDQIQQQYPEIATAIVRRTRTLRGQVRKGTLPLRAGITLVALMEEAERLAGIAPTDADVDATADDLPDDLPGPQPDHPTTQTGHEHGRTEEPSHG
jgi:hypothetical protein